MKNVIVNTQTAQQVYSYESSRKETQCMLKNKRYFQAAAVKNLLICIQKGSIPFGNVQLVISINEKTEEKLFEVGLEGFQARFQPYDSMTLLENVIGV